MKKLMAAILSLVFVAQPALAQQKAVRRVRQKQTVKARVKRQVDNQKRILNLRMNARVDELDRVCSLEDRQRKKLRIAAKGAIARSLEPYAAYYEQVYGRQFRNRKAILLVEPAIAIAANGVVKKAVKKKAVKKKSGKAEKPAADAKNAAAKRQAELKARKEAAVRAAKARAAKRVVYKAPTPEKEKIWLNAINKVLNEEQTRTYSVHVAARRSFNRRNGVGVYVSQMDQQLLLTEKQRSALEKLVDKKFGKLMETVPTNQIYANRGWIGTRIVNGRRQLRHLPMKELKQILSKAQFKSWSDQVRRFGGFNFFGGGAGAAVIEAFAR